MTANIVRIPNPAHEAICIQAIRARKRQECMAVIVPTEGQFAGYRAGGRG